MFLLDTLDSMPQLRVSDSLMKVFLWVLKESGAQNVPSFGQLRDVQAKLRQTSGVPSKLYKSAHGNLFYMNDIRKIVANVGQDACSTSLCLIDVASSRIMPILLHGHISGFILKSLMALSQRFGMQKSGTRRWTYNS